MTYESDREREFNVTRRASEQWIACFIMFFALVMGTIEAWRALRNGPDYRFPIVPICTVTFLYYAWAFFRARRAPPTVADGFIRTTIEVSIPTALIWMNSLSSVELALLNVPVAVWASAIFISVLRLRRFLPIYAGTLAAVEWIAVYSLLVTPELARHKVLMASTAWERTVLFVLCGLLAHQIGTSLLALAVRVTDTALERERVRQAFGAYVAEPVVERVLSGDLKLGTERRAISVLFVDIRDFTRFSEGRDPVDVLGRLNTALDAFAAEVRDRGGIVNKYLGDGLMALFGAPVDIPDASRQAALTAIGIARAAERLRTSGIYPELRVGIGLHFGEVVVGDGGGLNHREYTAIGDVVNVTSRVEAMTKELGVPVLVTEAVHERMGDGFVFGTSFKVQIRGRESGMVLHELVDGP